MGVAGTLGNTGCSRQQAGLESESAAPGSALYASHLPEKLMKLNIFEFQFTLRHYVLNKEMDNQSREEDAQDSISSISHSPGL